MCRFGLPSEYVQRHQTYGRTVTNYGDDGSSVARFLNPKIYLRGKENVEKTNVFLDFTSIVSVNL